MTLVRRAKPKFERKEHESWFVSVAYINNKAQLYDVVNVSWMVCNISPIETLKTNKRTICLKKSTLMYSGDVGLVN